MARKNVATKHNMLNLKTKTLANPKETVGIEKIVFPFCAEPARLRVAIIAVFLSLNG